MFDIVRFLAYNRCTSAFAASREIFYIQDLRNAQYTVQQWCRCYYFKPLCMGMYTTFDIHFIPSGVSAHVGCTSIPLRKQIYICFCLETCVDCYTAQQNQVRERGRDKEGWDNSTSTQRNCKSVGNIHSGATIHIAAELDSCRGNRDNQRL